MGMGMIWACFQMAGMRELLREWLKRWVRKLRPRGPRCFRCLIVRPSGPAAVEFPPARMALATWSGVKSKAFGVRGCRRVM